MKNKRRMSETSSSESNENGGEHVSSNDGNDGESQPSSKNNDRSTPVVRKSSSKRRSLRGASVQKSVAHMSDDNEMKDNSIETPESEQENGEKAERKSLLSKRGKKANRKASTSKNNKADIENEFEVCARQHIHPWPRKSRCGIFHTTLHDVVNRT